MAVISISATSRGIELIAGIPQFVSLETNIPATIKYTLDGSVPTILSDTYWTPIEMPTYGSIRLRAMAFSGSDIGYLDITYFTQTSALHRYYRIDGYGIGIAVDAYGVEPVVIDGYGADASGYVIVPVRRSDYELVDLDIKYSRTGVNGEGYGTLIELGPQPAEVAEKQEEIDGEFSSPNNQNVYFNPKATMILIDGRDGYSDQSVRIINRPLDGTLDPLKYLQGKTLYEPQPYISGGHVKTFYNYQTGILCAYYFDANECRWIKSIQRFDPTTVPRGIGLRICGTPLIYRWVYNKRSGI